MEKNCKETRKLLAQFVTGEVEPDKARQFSLHLDKCRECKKEAGELGLLFDLIDSFPEETPPINIKNSFYAMLDKEKNKAGIKEDTRGTGNNISFILPARPFWIQLAAGVALLIAGMFSGSIFFPQRVVVESQNEIAALQQDIKEMKQLVVFSLLSQESASERIKAVSYAMDFTEPDLELTEALFNTLNYDPNVNVRLSAIQALSNFASNGQIRSGLIESLEKQDDPMVQIMLINILVGMAEREAVQHFRKMADDQETLDIVRQHAEEGIKTLI